jgi:transglutaminase-like putative cysteine protease
MMRAVSPWHLLAAGLWLSSLFWPYAHSGGFPHPLLLTAFPLLLAAADLVSHRWLRRVGWAAALAIELVAQAGHFLRVSQLSGRLASILTRPIADWVHIPVAVGLLLILLAACLGWFIYREAQSRDRVLLLLVLGAVILALNHTFWHLPVTGPMAAYLALGLGLLASAHLADLAPRWAHRPPRGWYGLAGLTVLLPLYVGFRMPVQPGHWQAGAYGVIPAYGHVDGPSGSRRTGLGIGDTNINHPVSPSSLPVMTVRDVPAPAYWQAAVYSVFNGTSWSALDRASHPVLPGHVLLAPAVHGFPTQVWQPSFQIFSPALSSQVVYTGTPFDLNGTGPVSVAPALGEILGRHLTLYQEKTRVPLIRPAALATVPFTAPPAGLAADLEVPPALSSRLRDLAEKITAGAIGPWQAAYDLKRYLDVHEHYSYNFQPSLHTDPVDQFLFVTHRGYCDQFSTAFIMMSRVLGIPARWVVGYAPGSYDPRTRTYLVRSLDAHSWAEIYLNGYGWISVDPTPGWSLAAEEQVAGSPAAPRTGFGTGSTGPHPLPVPIVGHTKSHPVTPPATHPVAVLSPWLWGAATLLLGLMVLTRWLLRLWEAVRTPSRQLAAAGRHWRQLGRLYGLSWATGQTLREQWRSLPGPERERLLPVVHLLERYWYGGVPPSPEEEAAVLHTLNEALRTARAVRNGSQRRGA